MLRCTLIWAKPQGHTRPSMLLLTHGVLHQDTSAGRRDAESVEHATAHPCGDSTGLSKDKTTNLNSREILVR